MRSTFAAVVACLKRVSAANLSLAIWKIGVGFLEFPLVIVSKDANFFENRDAFDMMRIGEQSVRQNQDVQVT
jgi:hypothetical protein